jgi:phosphonate transport system substrate-binding protein
MIPSSTPDKMLASFALVKEYLEREMKAHIQVEVAGTYQKLIEAMGRGEVDIGLYGPFSYVLAAQDQRLSPLVVRDKKDVGVFYNSVIIVRSDSGIDAIEALRGRSMAFVDPASTSGFLVPSSLFVSRQIDIEKFFSSHHFSGSHDIVVQEVLDCRSDAGSVSSTILADLESAGKVRPGELRVLWKSQSIPGSPFVARAALPRRTREAFAKAMCAIHETDPAALAAFDSSAIRFVPAEAGMYEGIKNIVAILGENFSRKYLLEK